MLNNGDKIVVKKKVADFLDVGSMAKVISVMDGGMISFAFGDDFVHMGVMSANEFEEHFDKIEEKVEAPKIAAERIVWLVENSDIKIDTVFDKCTVVSCRLPNGFVIVESSACVSPENYDEETGTRICLEKIADKIWELEGYRLQEELYNENHCECECDNCCCDECEDCEEEWDEDIDVDCDNCEDYDCPNNPNR